MPHAIEGGATAIDKSSAYRLQDGIPLVVPEVNGARALENRIIANPNCCTIPLTCVLKPLHEEAGLVRVRVATYQSVSGAGAKAMDRLANEAPAEHDLRMDWEFDGEEFDEESKLRAETQKIMELPDLPIQATCVRVPVMVGHAEAIWIETEQELTPERATEILGGAPSIRLEDFPSPGKAAGIDDVLVGRIRRDPTVDQGLALFLASDNLRKGAALNAIQIAELVLDGAARAAAPDRSDQGRGAGRGSGMKASFTTRSTRCAPPLFDRNEPAELEPREPDAPRGAHDAEAEVAEEVGREHGAVLVEPGVRRLALDVAIREGLDRGRPTVARLADRRQEERLERPRRRLVDEVGARDQHRVLGRRPGRQLPRMREERRRPVLDHARASGRRRRSRPCRTRRTRPRRAPSSGPSRPRAASRATATRRSRGRPTARSRASASSAR